MPPFKPQSKGAENRNYIPECSLKSKAHGPSRVHLIEKRSPYITAHPCCLTSTPFTKTCTHTGTHTSCHTIQALPCGPLKCRAPLSKCKPYKDSEEQKPPRSAAFCPEFPPFNFSCLHPSPNKKKRKKNREAQKVHSSSYQKIQRTTICLSNDHA